MSTTPTRVSAERLKELWFSDDATGMTEDLRRGVRVVHMADGTSYEASLTDVAATR